MQNNMHDITRTHRKRRPYALYAAALCALVGFTLNNTVNASIFEKTTKEEPIFASLSGFEPNAVVNYNIRNPKGGAYTGTAQTDDFGNLMLPMPARFKNIDGNITYNFLIDDKKNSLNIVMMHNNTTNELSIEGSGTKEFTTITVESPQKSVETRSDWAGLFEEKNINDVWSGEKNQSYKIAFFSTDPARSIEDLTRTPIIQIQTAPNGGGPDSSGVNKYKIGNCQTPNISFCSTGDMNEHIENIVDNFVRPMQYMAEQLSANAMQQAFMIGTFFDADEQLDAQRDISALTAEANRDYQPSEQLCRIGSMTKSLASTDQKMYSEKMAFNAVMSAQYNNTLDSSTANGEITAGPTRLQQFRTTYCDISDNNGALGFLCDHDQDYTTSATGASDHLRTNKDIDFVRTYDTHYTLDVNFTDDTMTDDEEDVLALAKNLYWPEAFPSPSTVNGNNYLDARRVSAITNVAHNSFANQLAMKAKAPETASGLQAKNSGWAHIKTMMREFGLSDDDIVAMMGERPSYYAQMDVLTKKLYQSPDFYTNLYEGEVNIDRVNATLDAISLMQQRDHYLTMLRQEMLTSSMLQTEVARTIDSVQPGLLPRRSR